MAMLRSSRLRYPPSFGAALDLASERRSSALLVRCGKSARLWLVSPLGFFVAMVCFVGLCLPLDHDASVFGQAGLGAITLLVLVVSCLGLDASDRARVAAVVLVASCGEVLGSLLLGLYSYRLHNLPPFVPPGHGIIYLAGLRLSRSSLALRHETGIVTAAAAVGAGWALAGLTLAHRPDEAGAVCMLALICVVLRGRARALYGCMFLTVALLELYGTALGVWRWEAIWPTFGLSSANPPSGVAAGYCAFDAAALRLGPRMLQGWHARSRARLWLESARTRVEINSMLARLMASIGDVRVVRVATLKVAPGTTDTCEVALTEAMAAPVSGQSLARPPAVSAETPKRRSQRIRPPDLIAFCKERMAANKHPRQVEIMEELPKTLTGKLLRRELRDRERSRR